MYCLDQHLWAGILEEKASGARPEGLADVLVGVEGGDDDDRQRILDAWSGEPAGGLDAVEARHSDVDEAHVGT